MYVCMRIYIYVCMYAYIYLYIHGFISLHFECKYVLNLGIYNYLSTHIY